MEFSVFLVNENTIEILYKIENYWPNFHEYKEHFVLLHVKSLQYKLKFKWNPASHKPNNNFSNSSRIKLWFSKVLLISMSIKISINTKLEFVVWMRACERVCVCVSVHVHSKIAKILVWIGDWTTWQSTFHA